MKLAVYPGTFDPITNGHLEIIDKMAGLFDECVVAVLHNPDKRAVFTVEERIKFIQAATESWSNLRVDSFTGLLADYVSDIQADVVVRGLRSVSDFEAEFPMAHMNRRLNAQALTIFIPSSLESADISSSWVRQIAMYGGNVTSLVPNGVNQALRLKFPPSS